MAKNMHENDYGHLQMLLNMTGFRILSINLQSRHNLVEKRWGQDWQVQRVDQC